MLRPSSCAGDAVLDGRSAMDPGSRKADEASPLRNVLFARSVASRSRSRFSINIKPNEERFSPAGGAAYAGVGLCVGTKYCGGWGDSPVMGVDADTDKSGGTSAGFLGGGVRTPEGGYSSRYEVA